MRKPLATLALATSLVGASAAVVQAEPLPREGLIFGVDTAADRPTLDTVQYLWGGRNYCWYDGGWRGPGWYWCGYPWRWGYGWGGPYGWHGWYRGGWGWRGRGWDHGGWDHRGWDHRGGWDRGHDRGGWRGGGGHEHEHRR